VALQRDGAPVSITQIMPRTINTRCPTTLAPRWRRSVPKNSDLGIGRPPRGQPGVGVGALLAAVLTAWLHHLTATAHDGRLIGHGIRAGPAMITTASVATPRRSRPIDPGLRRAGPTLPTVPPRAGPSDPCNATCFTSTPSGSVRSVRRRRPTPLRSRSAPAGQTGPTPGSDPRHPGTNRLQQLLPRHRTSAW